MTEDNKNPGLLDIAVCGIVAIGIFEVVDRISDEYGPKWFLFAGLTLFSYLGGRLVPARLSMTRGAFNLIFLLSLPLLALATTLLPVFQAILTHLATRIAIACLVASAVLDRASESRKWLAATAEVSAALVLAASLSVKGSPLGPNVWWGPGEWAAFLGAIVSGAKGLQDFRSWRGQGRRSLAESPPLVG